MADITGTTGDDFIDGTSDDDTIAGGEGNDVLRGLAGDDALDGGDGQDLIRGGDGNDTVNGGEGDDILNGGNGSDRAAFALGLMTDAQVGATVDLAIQGVAQDTGHGMDTLISIENLSGTHLADTLHGDGGANWIWGQGGGDAIDGRGGDDLIELGAGDGAATGGDGVDTIDFGNDLGLTNGVTVSLALQGAAQDTGIGLMTLAGFENLSGSLFDDSLTGDSAGNIIAGSAGSDTLDGGDGDDTLHGDGVFSVTGIGYSGDITLVTDIGVDSADLSLDGNDILNGGAGADRLYGGGGDDTLEGGTGNDIIDGGAGVDTASYVTSPNSIGVLVNLTTGWTNGDAGNDSITGVENVIGSTISDTLIGDGGANVLTGLGGDDLLIGEDGDDTLIGGAGEDFLRGRNGDDVMQGGADHDYLNGGEGDDTFDGGDGIDRAAFSLGAGDVQTGVTVNLTIVGPQDTGHGLDSFISIEAVSGTIYDDSIIGDGGDNWLWGGSDGTGITGNDFINGGGGNDLVEVGTGAHRLDGGTGNDTLSFYGNSTDITAAGVTATLASRAGQDTEQGVMVLLNFENLSGSIHDDVLTGDNAANILAGAYGDDTLSGGGGSDILYGDGIIRVSTRTGSAGPITLIEDVGQDDGDLSVDGNDILDGGLGDDTIFGASGMDTLLGGAGNDTLFGGRDNDTLDGGAGHDVIDGGLGADAMTGGLGHDTFIVDDIGDTAVEASRGGTDVVMASVDFTLDAFVENLTQTGADDIDGTGNGLANILTGNTGANTLDGGAGKDIITGGAGDDTIFGGAASDSLSGGLGADHFVFTDGDIHFSSLRQAIDRDVILDLNFGDGDRIDLSAIDADASTVGVDDAFVFVGAFTRVAGQATLTWAAGSNTTLLQLDVDGDGKADFTLTMNGDLTSGLPVITGGSAPTDGGWVL